MLARFVPKFPGGGTVVEQSWLAGCAEAHSQDIIRVFAVRGVEVSEAVRARLKECDDLNLLRLWFERSLTDASAEELFFGDWG